MINSLIIEGNATLKNYDERLKICSLNLEVVRQYRNGKGEIAEENSSFEIYSYGQMADLVMNQFDKSAEHGIRVVGRLKMEKWKTDDKICSKVVIVAEHIEFKPQPEKNLNLDGI